VMRIEDTESRAGSKPVGGHVGCRVSAVDDVRAAKLGELLI
jgi:hypothetical protein